MGKLYLHCNSRAENFDLRALTLRATTDRRGYVTLRNLTRSPQNLPKMHFQLN